MSRCQFIDQQRTSYPMRLLCRVLGVMPGCYYVRSTPVASLPQPVRQVRWEATLMQTFTRHKQRYGTRRLRAELQAQGYRVGRQRLRTALRRWRLHAVRPRAFTPRTTDSTYGLHCAPQLAAQPASPGPC